MSDEIPNSAYTLACRHCGSFNLPTRRLCSNCANVLAITTEETSMSYLRQVIVVRKDLSMPAGKLAAMVAHASMTFIIKKFQARWSEKYSSPDGRNLTGYFTADEFRWMTELDPGLEDIGQISFAKIVCSVANLEELEVVEQRAQIAGLTVCRVTDSGHSHNKLGDVAAIAIGPAWPEQLAHITGDLKIYR